MPAAVPGRDRRRAGARLTGATPSGARSQGFAKGLVLADKQIKALQAASSGFFKGASNLLKQPQPRVYHLVEGKAEPQGAEQALGQGPQNSPRL